MRLNDFAKAYGDRASFLCVYIDEAHPTDGSQSPKNVDESILYARPTDADERAEIAAACMLRYNFTFTMVLDSMENEVVARYNAMPERLYVLDADGVVAWKCGLGPHYFDPAGFEEAIRELTTARAAQ